MKLISVLLFLVLAPVNFCATIDELSEKENKAQKAVAEARQNSADDLALVNALEYYAHCIKEHWQAQKTQASDIHRRSGRTAPEFVHDNEFDREYYDSQYAKSISVLKEALELRKKMSDGKDDDIIETIRQIALAYDYLIKRPDSVKRLLEEAISALELKHRTNPMKVVPFLKLYRPYIEEEQQEKIFSRILAIQEEALGPKHINLASTLVKKIDLSCRYRRDRRGRPKASPTDLANIKRVMEIYKEWRGEWKQDDWRGFSDLSRALFSFEMTKELRTLRLRTLALRQQLVSKAGGNCEDLLDAIEDLSSHWRAVWRENKESALGQYAISKAVRYSEEEFNKAKKLYALTSSHVTRACMRLDWVYQMSGQFAKAHRLASNRITSLTKTYGANSCRIVNAMHYVMNTAQYRNHWSQSVQIADAALRIRRRMVRPGQILSYNQFWAGMAHYHLGHGGRVRELLQKSLLNQKKPNRPKAIGRSRLQVLAFLADTYEKYGRNCRANELWLNFEDLATNLEDERQLTSFNGLSYVGAVTAVALHCARNGQYEKATKIIHIKRDKCRIGFQDGHPLVLSLDNAEAEIELMKGNVEVASTIIDKTQKRWESLQVGGLTGHVQCALLKSKVLTKLGKLAAAMSWATNALRLFNEMDKEPSFIRAEILLTMSKIQGDRKELTSRNWFGTSTGQQAKNYKKLADVELSKSWH